MAYIRVRTQDTIPAYSLYSGDGSMSPWVSPAQVRDLTETLVAFGPHIGLAPSWCFGDTGLVLWSHLDVGVLVGSGEESVTASGWSDGYSMVKGLLDTRANLGLSWTLPRCQPWLRFAAGYQFEGSVWLGRTFIDHGPFLHGEMAY
jgi:hypothetical protein